MRAMTSALTWFAILGLEIPGVSRAGEARLTSVAGFLNNLKDNLLLSCECVLPGALALFPAHPVNQVNSLARILNSDTVEHKLALRVLGGRKQFLGISSIQATVTHQTKDLVDGHLAILLGQSGDGSLDLLLGHGLAVSWGLDRSGVPSSWRP
jgi:hypothetical protein